MSTTTITGHAARPTRHHGPHPGILAIIYTLLLIISLVSYGILSHGAAFPTPFDTLSAVREIYLRFPEAIRVNALFQIGSAIPLGLLTAALTSRLKFLGVNVTGVSIAVFGGTTASILLIFSGLCTWVLSQPGIVGPDMTTMHALQLLSFCSGGIVFAAAMGLLMAGISVPCLFGKYAPRWLAWFGLVLAAFGEIAVLGLLIPGLFFLLPVVRFLSIIWMIGMGFTLIRG